MPLKCGPARTYLEFQVEKHHTGNYVIKSKGTITIQIYGWYQYEFFKIF